MSDEEEWLVARTPKYLSLPEFEALRTAATGFQALLGAHIEDSDYVYAFAATSSGVASRLLFNADGANDTEDGGWAHRMLRQQYSGDDWIEQSAQDFADWSRVAPKRIDARTVKSLLERRWVCAEDAIEPLLAGLGLPSPFNYVPPGFEGALWMMDSGELSGGGVNIDLRTARYALGQGDGYVGLWDRQAPGPPLRRFPSSREGLLAAHMELIRLLTRNDL